MGDGAGLWKSVQESLIRNLILVALVVLCASAGSFLSQLAAAGEPAGALDAACDRSCLDAFVDQYLAALVAHDPSRLPLASHFPSFEKSREIQ